MSTLIYFDLVFDDCFTEYKELDYILKQKAKVNDFGIHLINRKQYEKKQNDQLSYQISDNFYMETCSDFMASLIYDEECIPFLDELIIDTKKLCAFINFCFKIIGVKTIVLRFSDCEVDDNEYKKINIKLSQLYNVIISEYLLQTDVPTMKLTISK